MNFQPYLNRRRQLLNAIGSDGIAILFSATEQPRSNDTAFPFRQNSYFYYLSGFPEPEAVIILDGASQSSILFCRDKDPLRETWDGFRYGHEAAREVFGFDEAHSIQHWQTALTERLSGKQTLYALWGQQPENDATLLQTWYPMRRIVGRRILSDCLSVPTELRDLSVLLDPMRLIKDADEIALMKRAGEISAAAHCRAMQKVRPGMSETQLEAELFHEFMRQGARFPAYGNIVAGGKNACCLHYVDNNSILNDGDLVLIDAGAEYQMYAGDISRTFPVNGRFNAAQKAVYEIVLAANMAAIDAVAPGKNWADLHQLALEILVEGLIDLKLLHGSVASNIEQKTYQRFYMHGLGHWLGLDVHDVGGRWHNQQPILLAPGMITTIEPGLYIGNEPDIPEEFRNIGIRIEDNILVTEHGAENYTAAAPKTISDIEALMRE